MVYDIAIIGSGLNGMLLYNSLKQFGLNIAIIEKKPDVLKSFCLDNRTLAISRSSKTFLQSSNIWQRLNGKFGQIDYIYTFEKDTKPVLEFAKDDFFEGELGYIVLASDLLNIMYEGIEKNNFLLGIEIKSITQDENFCHIQAEKDLKIKAKMVFVCEGKNGSISQMLGIKSFKNSYKQKAITFIAKHSQNHKNIAVEQFTKFGPFATLPMKDPNISGFVWSLRNDMADYVYKQTKNDFVQLVNNELGRILSIGQVKSADDIISNINIYPLSISFLTKKCVGRINFIGDGLNAIHPVAGQALNMSINDIYYIAKNIEDSLKLGLDFGLNAYSQQNSLLIKQNHLKLNIMTDFLVKLYSNSNPILKLSRTLGLDIFESSSKLKSIAVRSASFGF